MDAANARVASLWRFPVKSMQGELLQEVALSSTGLVGDRAYALIDAETGKVVSAKSVRQFPDVLTCAAAFVEAPQAGHAPPAVRIDLPNGTVVTSDSPNADGVLSAFFGRSVSLAHSAPENFTIDQYHPDLDNLDPAGHRDTVTEQKLGSAFFSEIGVPSPVPVESFFDLFPLSVLTTSTLAHLGELQPESRFDSQRFRMNVVIDTDESGFVENGWVGQAVGIGDTVRLRVTMPDARCVMTTLAQGSLPRDNEILRTLARHNRLPIGAGAYPCAGVYAMVETSGAVRVGDRIVVE
ncbi:MAG: MOSC N-terminal beta barrel domain-containing protein [Acidimicrobiales bacterium]